MRRYAPNAVAWDVVNEAIDDASGHPIRTSVWSQVDDFMCKTFNWAHEADPNTELFYNDYAHASMTGRQKGKSDAVYNMIKDLKDKNCSIHGVGFQLHVDVTYNDSIEGVIQNMQRYDELGIKVHFTEIDVKCER